MTSQQRQHISDDHYFVGIGASAGGLEAIQVFFDHMPAASNLSFIIIQHLSSDFKSLLVELIGRHTKMKVFEAGHGVRIQKNCVYVIPNNRFITIRHDKLVLVDKSGDKLPNNAVDVFFHSLANDKKERAIGIILSGTGTDGTSGVAAIKQSGGMVFVQKPDTAKFDGMPLSAINSGSVDAVLAPEEMPEEILNLIPGEFSKSEMSIDDRVLREIFQLIQQEVGHDFHYYKTPTLIRRIVKRMRMAEISDPKAYAQFITKNPVECKTLAKEFLIGVTRFFRDPEAFDIIRTKVLPAIIAGKNDGESIKVWVCACSTGEEAYSLAIMIDQVIAEQEKTLDYKIFATDIERTSVDMAAKGLFPASIEHDISADVLRKYFTRKDDGYQINSRIRKQIVFAQHNVVKDSPFIRNDLVSCRNMLIYLEPELQKRVYALLIFALNKQGYLFLGTSEHSTYIKTFTQEISSKWKIYQKTVDNKLAYYQLHQRGTLPSKSATTPETKINPKQALQDHFRELLLTKFNFAAFYVDREFDIREAIGNFGKLLSVPKKVLRLNLLSMVSPVLSSILLTELKRAMSGTDDVVMKTVHLPLDQQDYVMQVVVKKPENDSDLILVAFHYTVAEDILATGTAGVVYPDPDQAEYIRSLEQELNDTKLRLQLAVENLETSNEELQSSNEELLSSNEELQSSNEELQSLNEELHTLNTEHQMKIRELTELNDDLNNYFRSSDIAQVFLDKNLAIRKFNAASARMINFIESDIGRPISHISTNIRYDNLVADIRRVDERQVVIEKEVVSQNGRNLLMRIMPYLTEDARNAGVVISFVDVTTVTNLNNIIRGVFNATPRAFFAFEKIVDKNGAIVDLKLVASNYAASQMVGVDITTWYGKQLRKEVRATIVHAFMELYIKAIEEKANIRKDVFSQEEQKWYEISAAEMTNGVVVSFTDVTQKKLTEEKIKRNYTELIAAKENLNRLNIELQKEVKSRTQLLARSEERFRLVTSATNDVVWDWDLIQMTVWWSDALATRFGYDVNEFTRDQWLSKIHPDDRQRVDDSIYEAINKRQIQWSAAYRFQKSDGSFTRVLDRGHLQQDENAVPYRFVGSMLDVEAIDLQRFQEK